MTPFIRIEGDRATVQVSGALYNYHATEHGHDARRWDPNGVVTVYASIDADGVCRGTHQNAPDIFWIPDSLLSVVREAVSREVKRRHREANGRGTWWRGLATAAEPVAQAGGAAACTEFVSPEPPFMDAAFACATCGKTQAEHEGRG